MDVGESLQLVSAAKISKYALMLTVYSEKSIYKTNESESI